MPCVMTVRSLLCLRSQLLLTRWSSPSFGNFPISVSVTETALGFSASAPCSVSATHWRVLYLDVECHFTWSEQNSWLYFSSPPSMAGWCHCSHHVQPETQSASSTPSFLNFRHWLPVVLARICRFKTRQICFLTVRGVGVGNGGLIGLTGISRRLWGGSAQAFPSPCRLAAHLPSAHGASSIFKTSS